MKYNIIRILIVLVIVFQGGAIFAGSLSMAIMAGASDEIGLVNNRIDYLNTEMRAVESATAGSDVEELESFYMPVISTNISYIHENIYFSIGWEYASYIYLKPQGKISTPTYSDNEIDLSLTRYTFPVSIGFVLPLDRHNLIYIAGGINFTYSLLKITQSNPGDLSSLGGKSNTYESFLGGYHFKIGAKSRIKRNLSFLLEVTSYTGKTIRSESEDELSKADTQMTGYQITAGIDYTVRLF